MDYVTDPNMPDDLRKIAEQIASGADPDEILGAERLWLYRAERDYEEISAAQTRFFNELRRRAMLEV